jgi:hypothetical protein
MIPDVSAILTNSLPIGSTMRQTLDLLGYPEGVDPDAVDHDHGEYLYPSLNVRITIRAARVLSIDPLLPTAAGSYRDGYMPMPVIHTPYLQRLLARHKRHSEDPTRSTDTTGQDAPITRSIHLPTSHSISDQEILAMLERSKAVVLVRPNRFLGASVEGGGMLISPMGQFAVEDVLYGVVSGQEIHIVWDDIEPLTAGYLLPAFSEQREPLLVCLQLRTGDWW